MAVAQVANAQAPGAVPDPPGAGVPEEVSLFPSASEKDARSGSLFLAPTALSAPQGTVSLQWTELLGIGASYAITDEASISVHTILPLDPSEFQPFMLNAKLVSPVSRRLHLGVQGLLFGALGDEEGVVAGAVGGIATYCLDSECHSLVNGYAGVGFGLTDGVENRTVPLVFSAGIVQRVTNHFKLVLEADSAAFVGDVNETAGGFLFWYGVRITGSRAGLDLGMVRPVGDDWWDDDFPAGFPFAALVVRLR